MTVLKPGEVSSWGAVVYRADGDPVSGTRRCGPFGAGDGLRDPDSGTVVSPAARATRIAPSANFDCERSLRIRSANPTARPSKHNAAQAQATVPMSTPKEAAQAEGIVCKRSIDTRYCKVAPEWSAL